MDGERAFRWALLALTSLLTFLLLFQYLTVILGAILLAYLLCIPHRRLAPVIGAGPAALGLLVTAIILVVVPAILLVSIAITGLSDLAEILLGEGDGQTIPTIDELLQQVFGSNVDVVDSLVGYVESGEVGQLLSMAMETIGGLSQAFISLTILFVLTYALLVYREDLLAWVASAMPLPEDDRRELFDAADDLMFAIVVGNVVIAVVDGALVGIALFFTGFGNVLFWTFISMFAALIPLVGSILVWLPAVGYLALTENYVAAAALALYGGVFIGAVDNFLRPYVGAKKANLQPALFIVGVFTGLALIGVMGLFYGPIALVMAKTVVEVLGPAEGADESEESEAGADENGPAEDGIDESVPGEGGTGQDDADGRVKGA